MVGRVKVGKYKSVFKGKFFRVEQASAVFPSGKKTIFERAVRPPSVVVFAFDKQKRVLITREYRQKTSEYDWRVPGGRVDKERNIHIAAQRELREETGYRAKKMKLFIEKDRLGILEWKLAAFLATDLEYDPLEKDEDEDISVHPKSLLTAYRMVLSGKIKNDFIATGILKLYRERKKIYKWMK
ncbi:MAG: NUDIX hydrolase [Candidatus Diapherotrites archaeon]|nr:NUDIX hydrolase [Candidatus Diapherotrites archaeon]